MGAVTLDNLFTIDCGEILLREFRVEDADAIYEITSQPEVYEFLPDWKSTREQRLEWLTNYEIPSNQEFLAAVTNIEQQNYLKLEIVLKETSEFIGFCNTGFKKSYLSLIERLLLLFLNILEIEDILQRQ